MMKSLCFALSIAATAAACGDDGGSKGGSVDAPGSAAAMITVSGTTSQISASGTKPLGGVTVKAFKVGDDSTVLAMATSAADGTFSMSAATGGAAFDGYLTASATGLVDSYLYPPKALSADYAGVTVFMFDSSTRDAAAFIGGAKQDAGMAFVAAEVLDASNAKVAGATVSITPAGGMIRYNGVKNGTSSGLPDMAATATQDDGIAYIFDQPAGDAMIGSMTPTVAAHKITARADVLTLTIIQ